MNPYNRYLNIEKIHRYGPQFWQAYRDIYKGKRKELESIAEGHLDRLHEYMEWDDREYSWHVALRNLIAEIKTLMDGDLHLREPDVFFGTAKREITQFLKPQTRNETDMVNEALYWVDMIAKLGAELAAIEKIVNSLTRLVGNLEDTGASQTIKPHQDTIDARFVVLKGKMSVTEAFNTIEQEIKAGGWEPEDYGIKDDPQGFNRVVNRRLLKSQRR